MSQGVILSSLKQNETKLVHKINNEYEILITKFDYRLIQPICLGGLINYFGQSEGDESITLGEAYAYASGIVLSTAFIMVTFHPYIFYAKNVSCNLRMACSGLIYKKALKILKSSAEEGQNGKIINILSSDLARFEVSFINIHDIWEGPLHVLLFLIVIYMQIGYYSVIGILFMLAFIPLQGTLIKNASKTNVLL